MRLESPETNITECGGLTPLCGMNAAHSIKQSGVGPPHSKALGPNTEFMRLYFAQRLERWLLAAGEGASPQVHKARHYRDGRQLGAGEARQRAHRLDAAQLHAAAVAMYHWMRDSKDKRLGWIRAWLARA